MSANDFLLLYNIIFYQIRNDVTKPQRFPTISSSDVAVGLLRRLLSAGSISGPPIF